MCVYVCVLVVLEMGHAADIFCTSAGAQIWLKLSCRLLARALPGAKEGERERWGEEKRRKVERQ